MVQAHQEFEGPDEQVNHHLDVVGYLDLAVGLLHSLLQLQDGQMIEHQMLEEVANLAKRASQSEDLYSPTVRGQIENPGARIYAITFFFQLHKSFMNSSKPRVSLTRN